LSAQYSLEQRKYPNWIIGKVDAYNIASCFMPFISSP